MLYNLHDDLLPQVQRDDASTLDAIDVLLLRYREGKHILTLGKRMWEAIKERSPEVRMRDHKKLALEKLRDQLDDRAGLLKSALVRVDLVPASSLPGWQPYGDRKVYNLHLQQVSEVDDAAATALIGEASPDLSVLCAATRARLTKMKGIDKLPFRTVALGGLIGGGGNIGAVVAERAKQRAPLIAVVDSDRSGRGKAVGSTLINAAAAVTSASAICPADLYELPARELENLLPMAWIEAALLQAQALTPDQSKRLREAAACGLVFPKNVEKRYNQVKEELDRNTLKRSADLCNDLDDHEIAKLLFPCDDGTWLNLTTLLAWWGCSNGKVRL